MSSDLCKPLPPTGSRPPDPPPKTLAGDPIEKRKLISKHFRICSPDIVNYKDLDQAERVADPIRKEFFDYYYINLSPTDVDTEYTDPKYEPWFLTKDKNLKFIKDRTNPDILIFRPKEMPDSVSGDWHYYVNFSLDAPFDERDVTKNDIVIRPKKEVTTFKLEPNYNMYFKEYEEKVNNSNISEKIMPNSHMYSFLVESLIDKDKLSKDDEYLKQLSFNKTGLEKAITNKNYSYSQYLEKFYTNISPANSNAGTAYDAYCVAQDDIVEYNKFSEIFQKTVNYCIYLEFPFDLPKMPNSNKPKETNFKKIFKITNTDLNLVTYVGQKNIDKLKGKGYSLASYYSHKEYDTRMKQHPRTSPWEPSIDFYQNWDMTNFFKNFENAITSTSSATAELYDPKKDLYKIFLGETNEALQKYQNNPTYKFFQNLMIAAAEHGFKKLVKENSVKNVENYFGSLYETPHEVLFYAIRKTGGDGAHLQTYYLANPTEEEKFERGVLKFVDTQIKYGVEYTYTVSAYCLVLGKKYKYEEQESIELPNGIIKLGDYLKITTEDYIPLIRVPLFTTSGKVMDHPPVPPGVDFHSLKGKNNEIRIRLTSENTEYWQVPKPITSKDEKEFEEIAGVHPLDEKDRLFFKTDDFSKAFEIFRTDVKPRNYRDFAGKKIKTYELEPNYISATHNDIIQPNKKYYYTFRAIDEHDHVSNPTLVYEVMLRDDAGFIYPEIRIVEFLEGDYYNFSSEMQTYIQINPSMENVFFDSSVFNAKESAFELNLDASGEEPPIGTAKNPVWKKNFKLRVTSKSSGKKVDVNFTFNKKHKKELISVKK
jgi:hypothetical protein